MRSAAPTRAMPPLAEDAPPLSSFEFWPAWAFYGPVWFWIGALMLRHRGMRLPLLANPGLPAGGLVGESKSIVFAALGGAERATLATWIGVDRAGDASLQAAAVETAMASAGLTYPVVAKPDIGCRGAGVRPLRHRQDLIDYLGAFPTGERLIVQHLVAAEGEAGVFYVRMPGAPRGRILSLTLKYFPEIIGDGASTLQQLIRADRRAGRVAELYLPRFADRLDEIPASGQVIRLVFAGNHCRGAIFRDGARYATDALARRFDRIADAIPNFHFGRFDIRFADFDAVRRGEGFTIVEFNGAGAESTHIWDSRMTLRRAWGALALQYRLLFEIGAANRARGHRPESLISLWRRWRQERRATRHYPPTA